jgi:HEAT repeat protein
MPFLVALGLCWCCCFDPNKATPTQESVAGLVKGLSSKERSIRDTAYKAFSELPIEKREKAIPLLIAALQVDDESTQSDIVHAIRKSGPKTIPLLIEAVGHSDARVRRGVVDALGLCLLDYKGTEAKRGISALIEALKDKDPGVRRNAAEILNYPETGEAARAIPLLIKTVKDDLDLGARLNAASTLRRFGAESREAIPVLIAGIREVAESNGNLQEENYPEAMDNRIREYALTLISIGTDSVPALMAVFKSSDECLDARASAGWALALLGPRIRVEGKCELVVPDVTQELWNKKRSLRIKASEILFKIGPAAKESLPVLTQTMLSWDPFLRISSAKAMTSIDPKNKLPVQTLAEGLQTGRRDIFFVLIGIFVDRPREYVLALPELFRVGERRKTAILIESCNALHEVAAAAEPAIPTLIRTTGDHDPSVRRAASRP